MVDYDGGLRADLGDLMLGRPKAEALQVARAGANYYCCPFNCPLACHRCDSGIRVTF